MNWQELLCAFLSDFTIEMILCKPLTYHPESFDLSPFCKYFFDLKQLL